MTRWCSYSLRCSVPYSLWVTLYLEGHVELYPDLKNVTMLIPISEIKIRGCLQHPFLVWLLFAFIAECRCSNRHCKSVNLTAVSRCGVERKSERKRFVGCSRQCIMIRSCVVQG